MAIGAGAAAALSRVMRSMLVDLSSLDPVALLASALLLGVVAVVAILIPAWRGDACSIRCWYSTATRRVPAHYCL